MVRSVTYVLLQPVQFHMLMLHSYHSYYFIIKKGTKVSVKQSSKIGLNLWPVPGNLSVVWWLCSFHGWRLFRQKKSRCKILAISIVIEREMLLRRALNVIHNQPPFFAPHFYFKIVLSLWNSTCFSVFASHWFPRETPTGKTLFTSWRECLGGIVLKELAALWSSLHSLVSVVPWKCWVFWTDPLRTLQVWLVGPLLRVW